MGSVEVEVVRCRTGMECRAGRVEQERADAERRTAAVGLQRRTAAMQQRCRGSDGDGRATLGRGLLGNRSMLGPRRL